MSKKIKIGDDTEFFDNVIKTAKTQINITGDEKITKIPDLYSKKSDFGQFRINGSYRVAKDIIETLIYEGYSVSVKELKDQNNKSQILIIFRFSEDDNWF